MTEAVLRLPAEQALIEQHFGAASHSYDNAARLQRVTGDKLISLVYSSSYKTVLDLGCGTGRNSQTLLKHAENVIGCDLSFAMAQKSQRLSAGQVACIQGDAAELPLQSHCVDLVFSNLMLQWIDQLHIPLAEIQRVLKPGAEVVFSTLLHGTLKELASAWAMVDNDRHVNQFKPLAELERVMAASGLSYSIEIDSVQLNYQDVFQLARELKHLGANYVKQRATKGLTGKHKWASLCRHYPKNITGDISATYQVAYVTAKRGS